MTRCDSHEARTYMRCLLREARSPMAVTLTEIIDGGRNFQHTAILVVERGPLQPVIRIRVNLVNLRIVRSEPDGEVTQ